MSKQSGDTGNSTHTLNGESWAVSGGQFLDEALNALKKVSSDQAEHLLARLEALGITGLTPDELEGLQALVSQARNQGQLYAQAPSGVVSDANPQPPGLVAPGGAQNPAGNGDAGSQQNGAGGEAGVPPTGQDAAPPPPPVPGATGVPRRNGVFGTGGVGDTNPLATGTGGQTPDGTGFGGALGGGTAAGAGFGGTALGGGLGGGGLGAASGSAPTGLSSDFGRLPSTLSGISLTSFNNFSFGNNATGSQGTGAGFTVSSSLGGATVTSSSDATAPFVQQSIGINGILATQTTVSPLLTSVLTQNSNSVSGTVGQGTITVQTVAPRTEQAQPPATPPTTTPPPVVENPHGTVSVTAQQASVSEGTGETSQTLTFTVTRSNPMRGDSVPYTLSGVDAADLVDGAQALSGQVTFAAGQSSATITVAVVADQLVEQNENLGVILGSGSYATPVGGTAVTRIDNDDFATLTIAPVEAVVLEGDPDDDGGTYRTISYTITRVLPEGNTTLPADTIRWEVDSGAQGALDIARVPVAERSGSVSFAAGQTEATITVRVEKNYEVDADQDLVVKVLDSTMAHADANLGAVAVQVTDDDPTIHFQAQQVSGVEGSTLVFTLARSSGINSSVDVDWSVVSANGVGDALLRLLGRDTLPTGTVHFDAGQTSAQITLATQHDSLVGDDERFSIVITGVSDGAGSVESTHVRASALEGSIVNTDALIQAEVVNVSDNPQTNVSTYTIRVSRSGALTQSHSLSYSLVGTGENPLDQDALSVTSGTVTFVPGVEYVDIQVSVDKNLVPRGLSSFAFNLDGTNTVMANSSVVANVVVDEVGVAVYASAAKAVEGTGSGDTHPQTFEIRLDQAATADVVIHWSTAPYTNANPALNASAADFGGTFPSGTVTIPAGETSATVTVTPSADGLVEDTERYLLNIDVASGPARVALDQAIGQILNDDARFGFATATVAGNEGNTDDNGVLSVQVVRQGYTRSMVSASWHVELLNGEATSADFVGDQDALGSNGGLPSGTIELIPGQVASTIEIAFVGNTTLQPDKDFRIVLDNPGFGTELGIASTTATILNDDAVLSVVNATMTVDEGNAGQSNLIRVALHREGDTRGTDTVTWQAVAAGSQPAGSGDIRSATGGNGVLATGTVTFADGADTAYITVPLVSDDVAELNETLLFQLVSASVGNTIDQAHDETLVTIRNDDDVVTLTTTSAQGTEDTRSGGNVSNGAIQFTLSRTGDLSKATTIGWTVDTSTGTASADDFVATTGTVTFAAGSSTATIVVVPSADTSYEADETFTLRLDTPEAGSGTTLGGQSAAVGTIVNDDVKVVVDHIVHAVSEGDSGTVAHTIYLTRVGDLSQGSTVSWSVAGSQLIYNNQVLAEAVSGAEFHGATSGSVTWAASDAAVKAITVYTTGDTVVEGDEAFRLVLASSGADRSDLQANGTYVVVPDDDAMVGIVRTGAAEMVEGAAGSTLTVPFTVTRSGDTASRVTVDWTATGASGIVVDHGTVTFDPATSQVTVTYGDGRPSQTVVVSSGEQVATVNVQVAGDDTLESGESLTVTLGNAQAVAATEGGTANVVVDPAAGSASVALTNDDDTLVVSGDAAVMEGNNPATDNPTYTFTITRGGDTDKETTVLWRLSGAGEVQVNAEDFAAGQEDASVPNDGLPSGRITFQAGQTSAEVTVEVQSDQDVEAAEGFKLSLDVPAGNSQIDDSWTAVLNGDDEGYNVTVRRATVTEGNDVDATDNAMVFELVRAGDTTQAVTVNWAVAGSVVAGDFRPGTALSGQVTFAAGESAKVITLPIQEDSVRETTSKTATLTLSNDQGGTLASASVTLTDDDAALSVASQFASVAEGTPLSQSDTGYTEVSFIVSRQGNLHQQSTVQWSVAGGVDANDFVGGVLPSGTLTFADTENEKTVMLQIRRDSVKEGDEALQLVLADPSDGTQVTVASATTTITNDDALVEFSAGSVQVEHAEGDGGTTAYTFTLTRSGYTNQSSTVHWALGYVGVGDNSAADRSDISSVNAAGTSTSATNLAGDVIFAANETSKTITVYVNADTGPASSSYSTVGSRLEGDESFKVLLSAVSPGTETQGEAVGVINNDDVRIQVTDVHTNQREGSAQDPENPGQAEAIPQWITLERQGDPSQAVSIYWYVGNTHFTNNANLDETSAAFGQQIASVSSTSDGVTLLNLDGDSVAEQGIITWAAGDTAPKTLQFIPTADDVASGDWNFTVYVKPVPASVAGEAYTAENASRTLIDEIGVSTAGSVVSSSSFATTGGIALATMTVKRDESGIWVSNLVDNSYDSSANLPGNGTEQYSGYDYVSNNTTPWDGANRDPRNVYYNDSVVTPEGTARAATEGEDYSGGNATLHFTEDSRVQHVTLSLSDDSVREGFETVSVFVNDGAGYGVDDDTAVVEIADDEAAAAQRIHVSGSTAIEGMDQYVTFKVTFGQPLAENTTLDLRLNADGDDQANANTDLGGSSTLYFRHQTRDADGNAVDDQLTSVLRFRNYEGSDLNSWLEFSDLEAGQSDLHVGGVANAQTLVQNGAMTESEQGISLDIWVPVRADASFDPNTISLHFTGVEGSLTGAFIGVADLSNDTGLNADAIAFMARYSDAGEVSSAEQVQQYFLAQGADDVQLLKFTATIDWESVMNDALPQLAWWVDGLDASDVVAPQYDSVFGDLCLVQEMTIPAGESVTYFDVGMAADAQYDSENELRVGDLLPNAEPTAPAVAVEEFTADGVHEIWMTVTRADATVADMVPYEWGYDWVWNEVLETYEDPLLSGSSPSSGALEFAVGETSKTVVFRLDAAVAEDLGYATTLNFDAQEVVTGDYRQSDGPVSALVQGGMEYSVDGGLTWHTQSAALQYTYNYYQVNDNGVADRSTLVFDFDNNDGSGLGDWLEFTDLAAGQEDLHVGGWANSWSLGNWGGVASETGVTFSIWIPVADGSVTATDDLNIAFAGVGVVQGTFAGIADLEGDDGLNAEAVAFMQSYSNAWGVGDASEVSDYFRSTGSGAVDLLKFTISVDWETYGGLNGVWRIDGLDVNNVVAPQWDRVFSNLMLLKDEVVAAGSDGNSATLALADDASFLGNNAWALRDSGYLSSQDALNSTLTSDTVTDGVRELRFQVTRSESDSADVVPYYWNVSGSVLDGSAPSSGELVFQEGESSAELVFRVSSGTSYDSNVYFEQWLIAERLSSNGVGGGSLQLEAGVEDVLVRYKVQDDNIDEGAETLSLTVSTNNSDFVVNEATGEAVLIDDDAPELYHQTYSNTHFNDRGDDFRVEMLDVNCRYPNGTSLGTLYYTAGSSQDFTVTLTLSGDWEVALVENSDLDDGSFSANDWIQHYSGLPWSTVSAGSVADDGTYTYALEVPAGTARILLRSLDDSGDNAFEAEITHVDPVIVVRNTEVDENAGTVDVEVVAVGGDLPDGGIDVDVSTEDGTWVDYTFVFSREFSASGEQTATWVVEAVSGEDMPDGNNFSFYVNGYFGAASLGTVSPDDFVILGDQSADATTGMPSGVVTFADGEKEATVTIRVRADAVGEPDEEFRVRLVDTSDGAQMLGNPQASATYAQYYDYSGYARITNDDPVFRVETGKVLHESSDQAGVVAEAPDGYTLHTFTIVRDGDATAAAAVDWFLEVSGGGPLTSGGVIGSVNDTDMVATTADFGGSDAGVYALSWNEAGDNGLVHSLAQTVTFDAGESSKVVTFAVKDDALVELAEVFRVVLTNPQPLPGNETLPGVSETRGYADFLIGDNDGEKVSVAISTQVYDAAAGHYVVNDAGTVIDRASGLPMVEEGTSLTNKNQVVLTFTRTGDLSAESQAYYEMTASDNNAASGMTLASGVGNTWYTGLWYGVVTFAANSATATVVYNVASDNLVEADTRVTVTLYDYEHLPESVRAGANGFNGGANGPTIGLSSMLPNWDTTIRDPDAYVAEAVIKNDDVRLWLNSFTNTYSADSANYTTPTAAVTNGGSVYEGGGASGAGNDLTLTFARAGRQDNDVVLNWTIVHNGTNASDFASTSGTLTLPGTASTVQANAYTTQTVTLEDFFAADYLAEENENFQILFTSADTTNVKFTYDFVNEGSTHWGTGSAVSRVGSDTMKVGVTILNDDVIYSIDNTANLSNGVAKVTEGAAGAATDFTFNVHRQVDSADANVTGGYAGSSTVYWRVVTTGASHAVDASDFVLLSGQSWGDNGLPMGSVTFAGSVDTTDPEVLKEITLRVRGDSAVEYGEGFTIELYDPTIGHVDASHSSFEAVIVNDDTGIAINDVSVVEGNTAGGTTVQFTVTRSGALNLATSADWTKVDVSTDEADFSGATSGSVSFASTTAGMVDGYGEETRTVTLTYSGDDVPEADLGFNVQLSGFAGVSDIIDRSGSATLQNDDSVFSVAVSEGNADSHVEGDGQGYSFTITRTHDTAQAQTVQWAVAAGGGRNMVDADDFDGTLPSGTVVFQPGEFSKTVTFDGSSGDVTSEADERFVVHLTLGAGGDSSTIATNDAVGVVVNDDPGIYINDSQPVVQREGTGGSSVYQFDVTAFGLPANSTTSVNWEIVLDGSATTDDFVGPLSGTVTFSENGTQTVSVGLATDSDLESSESFHIRLSNSDNIISSTNNALGTIGDDDYTLAVANAQVVEGDGRKSMQFVFTRTGSSTLPVEVSWAVAEGTASAADFPDGVLPSGSFTLPSGATSYTLSVPIQGDIVLEGNETFTLNASYDGGTISGTGTITNDDEEFAVAPIATVDEGSSAAPGRVQFTITRSGNLAGTSAVTWTIAGSGDHPAADADFSLLTGTVTFADGQPSQVVSVPLVGNGLAEFDKGYTVTLSDPAVASSISVDHGTGDGVIANDDLGFAVAADQASVVEGNDGTTTISWTVTRSGGDLSQSVTVDWALSGLTGDALQNADFDSLVSSGRVTFAADQTEATVSVTLVGDSHPETLSAPLSLVLSNPSAGGTLLTSSAAVSVMDDDDGFTIVAMDGDQMEGDSGTRAYTYRVTRSGVLSGESTVDWSVSGSGFHALSAAEFVGATSGTLTFGDGESEKTITVQVAGDTVGEYDEAFTVSLGNASSGSEVLSGVAGNTVFNDDPVLFISMADTTVEEGDASADRAFTFVVRRSGDTTGTASVAWAIEAGSGNGVDAEDFGGLLPTGVVVFTPGQTEKTVTVLTGGDNDYELNETFNIVLSNAVNATILEGEVNNAVLVNDDTRVQVSVDHAQQAEGNSGDDTVFRFFLDAVGLADHVQIQWHLEGSGDHPLNDADYADGVQKSGTTTVELSNNIGQEIVAVTINGDDVKGYDETFRFVVDDIIGFDADDNQVGAGLGGADAVTATVLDDDSLISFHTTQASVAEGDSGTSLLSFVVSRSGSALALGAEVSVDYQVVGGFSNSASASDFLGGVLPSGTVTFAANQTEATISIAVQGDTLVEGDEKFSLTLANPTAGASIATTNAIAQGTILADDSGVQINCPMVSQGEDQARFAFDILRTGPLGEAVDMTYTLGTADQTAFDAGTGVSASDFTTALTGTIHFDAGQSQARFYVDVAHDSVAEADEHFAFQVDYGAASDWVDCTIVNDDIGSVTPPVDQLDVVEHHP